MWGELLTSPGMATNKTPIIVSDPSKGIEWDFDTGTLIYTLINPVLMPEKEMPIDYSVAYFEILPGGSIVKNRLIGLTELMYVIEGDIEIISTGGTMIQVPAGSAGFVPGDREKEIINSGKENAIVLSVVDPAWVLERAVF